MKTKIIAVTLGVAALIIAGAAYLFHMENYDSFFYCKVMETDSCKETGPGSDLPYEYTLTGYSEKGEAKKLTFKTAKKLEPGQCLKLEVRTAGVYHYDEIPADQLRRLLNRSMKMKGEQTAKAKKSTFRKTNPEISPCG